MGVYFITMIMIGRPLLVLLAFVLLALLAAFAVADRVAVPAGVVYTVAEVKAGMARQPIAWVGRTVLVRGIAYPMAGSSCPPANPYCTAISLMDETSASASLTVAGRPPDGPSPLAFLRGVPVLDSLATRPREPVWARPATYRIQFVAHPYSSCTLPCMGLRLVGIAG